jgi:hypothetical protein
MVPSGPEAVLSVPVTSPDISHLCCTPVVLTIDGSVSKVGIETPMALIYKVLFLSISMFETPPNCETRER